MPDARDDLVERVRSDLEPEEHVRGLWLTGSMGAGTADAWSDVDMFLLVPADRRDAVVRAWPSYAALHRPLLVDHHPGTPVFAHVLPGWLRWDVVVGTPGDLQHLDRRHVRRLFAKDGDEPGSPGHRGADPDVVVDLVEEFLRVTGLLVVVVERGELVTAVAGAGLLRQLTTTLLRYRAEGDRLTGALHLRRVLPAADLAALGALPTATPDRAAVIEAHLATAALFLPIARAMAGPAYPRALEEACRAHLDAHLGVTLP